jgi:hypothetical protein
MNRREFAYVSALAGIVLEQAPASPSKGNSGKPSEAAGLLTEMIFVDDCVRLAMYDDALSKNAKKALTDFPDFVRNGLLSPPDLKSESAEKHALVAGRHLSAALREHRSATSPNALLYQDVVIMRDLANAAGRDPAKATGVLDLLNLLHTRRRLGLHTLNPDADIQVWLEGIVKWWRDQHVWLTAVASAYTSPDPAKLRETVEFYNSADPLIGVARRFQFAQVAPVDMYKQAVAQAPRGSQYSRALHAAMVALQSEPALV